jgi:glycosyltransferase involved in cell wall biosynthesis
MPLKIAAKVDAVDREYFEREIEPLLQLPGVEFVGEISDREKSEFLSGAEALLMPIDWPEPFGLVMIEAMACGAPVVAYGSGSVPEIVEDGLTGFIVKDEIEASDAIRNRLGSLSRTRIRARIEERFTARRMANEYLEIYRKLVTNEVPRLRLIKA